MSLCFSDGGTFLKDSRLQQVSKFGLGLLKTLTRALEISDHLELVQVVVLALEFGGQLAKG